MCPNFRTKQSKMYKFISYAFNKSSKLFTSIL